MTHPFCYNEITAKTTRGSCSAPSFRTFDHLRLSSSNHLFLNVFAIARSLGTSACTALLEHRLRLFPVVDLLQTVRSVPASPRCHVRFTRRTTSRRFCGPFLTWSPSVVFVAELSSFVLFFFHSHSARVRPLPNRNSYRSASARPPAGKARQQTSGADQNLVFTMLRVRKTLKGPD